jgi:arginine decarboxylase
MLAFYFRASDDDDRPRANRTFGHAARVTRAARREVPMFWKQVTKASMTAGTAEGGTPLNAFDNALLAAGIGNVNLIKVSSIVPPEVDIVDLPQIKPGALVPTAYAAMTSATPGQIIAAAVGYALPVDRTKAGVIMEFHDVTDRGTAEEAIRGMLAEAFRVRGETIREVKVVAVDHRVERAGCALAAVALLSEDDLL